MSLLTITDLYEKRPLKKAKLGPPDVYPQENKQKEDELTVTNVKQGYSNTNIVPDEYGSARNANLTYNRFGEYFSGILTKKQELNTMVDTSRKKLTFTKDSALYLTAKNRPQMEAWFKDLVNGTKPLSYLVTSRRIPFFNKKEEIFAILNEFDVPMNKSIYFLKLSCALQTALNESNNKSKKRQLPDPSQEWTICFCRFLKEHYSKLCEGLNSGSFTNGLTQQNNKGLLKQWNYWMRLAYNCYHEGLFDRNDFLSWLLELFEKIKSVEDPMMHLIVPLLIQYADEYTQSEFLSRRLAFYCAKKINQFLVEYSLIDGDKENKKESKDEEGKDSSNTNEKTSPLKTPSNDSSSSNLSASLKAILSCSKHRPIVYGLSYVMQQITLECSTALVWLSFKISDAEMSPNPSVPSNDISSKYSFLLGSPLDHLPCEPSNLPIAPGEGNDELRRQLRCAEELIKARSVMAEKKWSFRTFDYTNSPNSVGNVVNRLFTVLDLLDKHQFEKVSSSNSLDCLYDKIFVSLGKIAHLHTSSNTSEKNKSEQYKMAEQDGAIVKLLCEWSVTTKRLGEYRARVVAKLLEKRQNDIFSEKESQASKREGNDVDGHKSTQPTSTSIENNAPVFQQILFEYLDLYAPIYEDKALSNYFANTFSSSNTSTENKLAFNNLVLLFSELIRHEVFSHDIYMRTLISRGHFVNPPNTALVSASSSNHVIKNNNEDSLSGLVPLDSNGGLMSSTIHKSTSSSSLPMFDPLSNNSNMNNTEQSTNTWNNDTLDEAKIDEDLDKILQNIKAGQNSLKDENDAMESDKEDEGNGPGSTSTNANSTSLSDLPGVSKTSHASDQASSTARHLLYTLHFPLPQDEFFTHECNQRHILLYGVGKSKDEAKHSVKKVTKEVQKLFSRKTSMDICDGGKVKKHVIKEGFNFENVIVKFQNLSIFDQQVVANTCASTVLEMLSGVVGGTANHLPLIESLAFLFDLMEIALNVHGLVEFIVQMLKELAEVEQKLQDKCPLLARPYCTSIGLYMVGVLNRYHTYVLASTEDIVAIFDGLWKMVRHVSFSECSSAERCIFFYIYDLNYSCSHLLKKYQEAISPLIIKIKKLQDQEQRKPVESPCSIPCLMMQYLKTPRLKVDATHIRQLNENPLDRYSMVFNAILCAAGAADVDYLNELSVLCAELTASCYMLSFEWLCAFKDICNTSKKQSKKEYSQLVSDINLTDRNVFDNLAVFVSILVARRCFCLGDFLYNVVFPSLVNHIHHGDEETELSARLTCHLLLYIFKYYDSPLSTSNPGMNLSFTSSSRYSLTSPGPLGLSSAIPSTGQKHPFVIKYACDRYLLGGAISSLTIESIFALLKAIYIFGTQSEKNFKNEKGEIILDSNYKSTISGHDDEISFLNQISSKSKIDEKPSTSDSAKYVLRQICMQDLIHDRCLRYLLVQPDANVLMDKKLLPKDSQYLYNLICYHKDVIPHSAQISEKSDVKQITRVFQNLDEWSLRVTWLQLHVIYKQLLANTQSVTSSEVVTWLDTLARAVIDFFQQCSQSEPVLDYRNLTLFTSKSSTFKHNSLNLMSNTNNSNERIWLVVIFVSKLPSVFRSKILRMAATVLDSPNWLVYSQASSNSMSSKSKSGFKNNNNSTLSGIMINPQNCTSALLSYQPFVSLLLMCLESKDDNRESLLISIYSQISQSINEKLSEDIRMKTSIQDGLQLRFSLVGAMFDVLQSSTSFTNDWALLLLQLICYSIVDPDINFENFATVLDMLCYLMHASHVANNFHPEQREESKRLNQNLVKKLKKELNVERNAVGLLMAKQLLPLVKIQADVIACEPMGSLVDTKGNKIAGFDSIDKKQGLQVSEKHKLSPWDMIEGNKSSAPFSWTWFGSVRMERKPQRMEENFFLLSRHNHNIRKPMSFYIEPPPLPPEEEPAPPPPPPLMPSGPMHPPPFANSVMPGSSMTNMQAPPHPPHQSHASQPPSGFNPIMHSLGQTPTLSNQFHSHMHHPMPNMPNPNVPNMPIGPLHTGPNLPTQASPHMMSNSNSDHSMGQPVNHMMMSSQQFSNSPMLSMGNMQSNIQMDMIDMPPTGPGHVSHQMPSTLTQMRPPMTTAPPPPSMTSMPNVPRATTPKATKAKVPRRRRNTKSQAVNGTPPVGGQQTPPIRIPNNFDSYNSTPVNQMGQAGNNGWPYQQQLPGQPNTQTNVAGQPTPNTSNQSFYQSGGPANSVPNNQANQAMMQHRFSDNSIANTTSKVRLRTMLNARHPQPNNNSSFNMAPSGNTGPPGGIMNSPQSTSMISGGVYPPRQPHMTQMMQQRPPMRQNQSQMFQQQQQQQANSNAMHHHLAQQQQANFAGSQNLPFNNNSTNSSGYQAQQQQSQSSMMMRPQQMQGMASQQMHQQHQAQFMQQRTQQFAQQSMGHTFGQQQPPQHSSTAQMMGNTGPQWSQSNSLNSTRPQMTQLQRQLSSNQSAQGQQGTHSAYQY